MSIIGGGCCCGGGICSHAIDRIMSKNGLISDCHVGIQPSIGEVLGVSMQSSNFYFEYDCGAAFKTTTGTK